MRRPFDLAEAAKSPLAIARVQIAFARFLVLHTGLAFLRSGDGDDSIGAQAETALQLALSAAKTYSDFGIPRSVVIALNAAAEAAFRTRRSDARRRIDSGGVKSR